MTGTTKPDDDPGAGDAGARSRAAPGDDPGAGPGDDPRDAAALAGYATALADGVDAALPGWVERSVTRMVFAWRGEVGPVEAAAASEAGAAARADIGPKVRRVLETDIDAQTVGPLAVIRTAVVYPTRALASLGVPPVVRDEFVRRRFPDDVYDLSPATFADLDPDLHELGLTWGAAKAHVHLARRRRAGQR